MKTNEFKIAVKNMVCNRCIKVISEELQKKHIDFIQIELGTITFKNKLSPEEMYKIDQLLKKEGFELLEDREKRIVNDIKSLIIESIHYNKEKPDYQNFSSFISENLNWDYSYLSKLFSELNGKTIEQYIIEQKIERVKELIKYNELNLTQISYELNYSSPQHLSKQFKQITGMTPSAFKKIGVRKKLDKI